MVDSIHEKDRISVAENDFYSIQIMKLRKEFYLWEMAALLLNVNPMYVQLIESNGHKFRVMVADYTVQDSPRHSKNYLYQELKKAMIDAVEFGGIELFGENKEMMVDCVQDYITSMPAAEYAYGSSSGCACDMSKLHRDAVQAWVEKFNFETSFFETKKVAVTLPNHLNKNHPEHSLELGIAVEAWERFSDLDITHPKAYLEKWMQEKYGGIDGILSDKAIERITTLVNWNKSGGVTSNPFTKATYQQALDKEITTFSTQPKP